MRRPLGGVFIESHSNITPSWHGDAFTVHLCNGTGFSVFSQGEPTKKRACSVARYLRRKYFPNK